MVESVDSKTINNTNLEIKFEEFAIPNQLWPEVKIEDCIQADQIPTSVKIKTLKLLCDFSDCKTKVLIGEGRQIQPFRISFSQPSINVRMAFSLYVQDNRAFFVLSIYKYLHIIAVVISTIRFYRKVSLHFYNITGIQIRVFQKEDLGVV